MKSASHFLTRVLSRLAQFKTMNPCIEATTERGPPAQNNSFQLHLALVFYNLSFYIEVLQPRLTDTPLLHGLKKFLDFSLRLVLFYLLVHDVFSPYEQKIYPNNWIDENFEILKLNWIRTITLRQSALTLKLKLIKVKVRKPTTSTFSKRAYGRIKRSCSRCKKRGSNSSFSHYSCKQVLAFIFLKSSASHKQSET